MEIIQEIGSYAGFAAVLGLAVLSALYFSQARDVKRLREWAGRAPERTTPPVQPQRVVAQPIARPPQPAGGKTVPPVPRPPGAQPGVPGTAPAQAAAAGAAPAVAKGPAPATPAAATAASESSDSDVETSEESNSDRDVTAMDTVVHPPPTPPEEDERDDGPTGDEQAVEVTEPETAPDAGDEPVGPDGDQTEVEERPPEEDGSDDTGEWSPEDEHSDLEFTDEHDVVPATPAASAVRPPVPPRPLPRRPVPPPGGRYGRSPILPPYEESRPKPDQVGPARSGRRPVLVAVAAVVAIAVGTFAVLQLTGGDESGTSDGGAGLAVNSTDEGDGRGNGTPIDPSTVTVAVLNGTTVPGLAATLGDQIAGQGFQLGTVTNNFDQERAESVVLYAPDAEREAAAVARRLDISQREPIDPDSQSLAGDATVVVVAGADQNQ